MANPNVYVGQWTYRSWLNDPNLATPPANLLFGSGTIEIVDTAAESLRGTIGGPGWQLDLTGSRSYGDPGCIRFRGKGTVSGVEWIYDYVGYLVPEWPEGIHQKTTMVGSIVRAIPHGPNSPAGVTASWYAVKH